MDTMNGMFRGICVDNRDPKNLGRIRVQVPQMLGASASGWAFPAWSFHQKTIWPQDRLPKPGDGVWVMFDATSPDKMIWVGAFGALDLINQPEFVEAPDFASTLTMTLTGTPTWNTTVTFDGVLGSDLGGVPNPNPTVVLTGRVAGGDWISLGSVIPSPVDGSWTLNHLIRLTGSVEYRATFSGVGVYGATSSDVIAVNTPVVTFPTALLISITGSPALNGPITFSGTLLTTGSPPAGYEVPKPGATVNVNCRPVGDTAWQSAVANIPVNQANGAWSSDYTITIPGAVEYQAVFGGLDVFLSSVSGVSTVNTSVGTDISTFSLPALTHGSGFNISGTIKVASSGANVTSGVAELWWRYTMGGDQAWKKSSVSQTITAGSYSLTHPALSILGSTEWQVRYVGDSHFDPANSAAVAATVNLPNQGALTKGAISHTSAAFSWAAVSGATSYEVERWNGSAWIALATTGATSYTDSTILANGQYWWRVRPKATNVAGTTVYGGYSANISMTTGRPAQTSTGSTADWIVIPIWADDSWRNDTDDWAQVSDMRQGYFTDPSRWYIGAAIFKGSVVKDALVAAIGAANQANGTCTAAAIEMSRVDQVGTFSSPIATTFYRSTTTGSSPGGKPDLLGTGVAATIDDVDAGRKWYSVGTAHGQALGDGDVNSIVVYKTSAASYAAFRCYNLRLMWTWNYTSVTYVAPVWV